MEQLSRVNIRLKTKKVVENIKVNSFVELSCLKLKSVLKGMEYNDIY